MGKTNGFWQGLVAIPLKTRRWTQAVVVVIVLFLSLWPRQFVDVYISEAVQSKDRPLHAAMFFALAVATMWPYACRRRRWLSIFLIFVGCALLGGLLEWMQGAVPGINRSASMDDAMYNAIGAILGVLALPKALWPRTRNL